MSETPASESRPSSEPAPRGDALGLPTADRRDDDAASDQEVQPGKRGRGDDTETDPGTEPEIEPDEQASPT